MARGQTIGPQIARHRQKVGEFRPHVATDAGDRRAPVQIIIGKAIDHAFTKGRFVIVNIMGNAQTVGHFARIANVIARTACALAFHRFAMVVKLQRDADHLGPAMRGRAATTDESRRPTSRQRFVAFLPLL
jgi:hypothetical protein